tara:strand:+ start:389 stop:547 length:159 start_codon:yes stop_codon:yes gene_type:complete
MTWTIWCEGVEKDADDYTVTGIEMETHLGRMYLGKTDIYLTEPELELLELGA